MSMISSLRIKGIRSFGVEDDEKQDIQFRHPLTLIVGRNGAGKTTIIECLKYITTGDQPANSRGGAFIHDPKLIGRSDVTAEVGLTFSDVQGEKYAVKRVLQAKLQRGGKIRMTTLDSFITKQNQGGSQVSMRKEFTNEGMVSLLGVSKAVLENVVFCHQEDSNWPLSEGKTLKEKFDKIFDATRYIKSLDRIKLAKKSKETENKLDTEKLVRLKENCELAKERGESLQDNQAKLDAASVDAEEADKSLRELQKKLTKNEKLLDKINDLRLQLRDDKTMLQSEERERNQLEGQIKNKFEGTKAELAKQKATQEKQLRQMTTKFNKDQKQIDSVRKEIAALSKKETELASKQGKLQQVFESVEEKKKERNTLLRKFCQEYKLQLGKSPRKDVAESTVISFETKAENLIKKNKKSLEEKQKKAAMDIEGCEEEIYKILQQRAKLEAGIEHKQQAVEERRQKVAEIKNSSDAQEKLVRLKDLLLQAENILEDAENSPRIERLEKELADTREKKKEFMHKLQEAVADDEISRQHEAMRLATKTLTELQSEKLRRISEIKQRNVDKLASLGLQRHRSTDKHSFPTAEGLEQWISEKENEIKALHNELQNKRQELFKLISVHDAKMEDLQQKRSLCDKISSDLSDVEMTGREDEVTRMETVIKKLQDEKGLLEGRRSLHEELLKALKSSADSKNEQCPLCCHHLSPAQEMELLVQTLEQKYLDPAQKIQSLSDEITKKQDDYKLLLKRNEAVKEMRMLQSEVLPDIEVTLSELESKATKMRSDVSEKEEVLHILEEEIKVAKSCFVDVSTADTIRADVADIASKITVLKETLPHGENLEEQRDSEGSQIQSHLQAMLEWDKAVDEKRDEIEKQKHHLFSLKENVFKLQVEKLEAYSNLQKTDLLGNNVSMLESEIEKLESGINESETDIASLASQFEDLQNQKEGVTGQSDQELKILADQIISMTNALREVTKLSSEIEDYTKSGKRELRDNNAKEVEAASKKQENCERQLQTLEEAIDSANAEIIACQDSLEMLQENQKLKERSEDVERMKARIAKQTADVEKLDLPKAQKENEGLNREKDKLTEKMIQCNTSRDFFLERVKSLEEELGKDNLRNADEDYKDCMFRVTATKIAISDLDKYCKAMHYAILRYHEIKMLEINQKIKEIWRKMYRGHDIDYIEIVSESEPSTTSSRTVYNYRVVKCSQGSQIDMRGRCSAGQKVIASLVIRLALAETFCINCGILALDEPTTNLDHHHIKSLAKSLISIAREKEAQRNFQLLVITHNEDFAEKLGREGYIDHFFRIEKINGRSRVTYAPIGTPAAEDEEEQ